MWAGPNTSCPFALNVATNYNGSGPDNARSPTTGQDYTMSCSGSVSTTVLCTGGNDASVKWGQDVGAAPAPTATTPAPAPSSGVGNGNLTRCGLNSNQPQAMVYSIFAGPGTSCPFADNVGDEYTAPGTETVYNPTTGQTYAMNCQPIGPDGAGGHEIKCTGGNDAVVEFDVTS